MKVWKRGAVFLLSLLLLLLQCPVAVLAEYGADALDSGVLLSRFSNEMDTEKGLISGYIYTMRGSSFTSDWPNTLSIDLNEGNMARSELFLISAESKQTSNTNIEKIEIVSSELEDKIQVHISSSGYYGNAYFAYFFVAENQNPPVGTYEVQLKITMEDGVSDISKDTLSLFIENGHLPFIENEAVFQVNSFSDFSGKHISRPIQLNTSVRTADRIELIEKSPSDYNIEEYEIVNFNPNNATFEIIWTPDEKRPGGIRPARNIDIQVYWKARRSPAKFTIPVRYRVNEMEKMIRIDYDKQLNQDLDRTEIKKVITGGLKTIVDEMGYEPGEVFITDFKSSVGTPLEPEYGFFVSGSSIRVTGSQSANYSATFNANIREIILLDKNHISWKIDDIKFEGLQIEASFPPDNYTGNYIQSNLQFSTEDIIDLNDPSTYRIHVECGNYISGGPYIEKVEIVNKEQIIGGHAYMGIDGKHFMIENWTPISASIGGKTQRVGGSFDLVLKNEDFALTEKEVGIILGHDQRMAFRVTMSDKYIYEFLYTGSNPRDTELRIPVILPGSLGFYSTESGEEILSDTIQPGEIKSYFVKTKSGQLLDLLQFDIGGGNNNSIKILKGEAIDANSGFVTIKYTPDLFNKINEPTQVQLIAYSLVNPQLTNSDVKIRLPKKEDSSYYIVSTKRLILDSLPNKSIEQTIQIDGKKFYILISNLFGKDNLFFSAEQKYSFVKEAFQDVPEANRAGYNVDLLDYDTWKPVANPGGRIPVTLPYPDGSKQSDRFVILHMPEGKTPEIIKSYKKTDDGLSFEVDSLSPFVVGYLTNTGLGDVNGDGSISVVDVFMLHKYLLRKVSLDDDQILRGDINGDGQITLVDIFKMHKFILKKITNLG